MAQQTPLFKHVRPTERERLLMDYAATRRSALNFRYRAEANIRSGRDASLEVKFSRQDAAECRKIWQQIQSL